MLVCVSIGPWGELANKSKARVKSDLQVCQIHYMQLRIYKKYLLIIFLTIR